LPRLIGDWDHAERKPGTPIVLALQDIALVAVLDHDADALDAIRRILAASPKAMPYSPAGVRSYDYGKPAAQLALAYDLVHPDLTPEERRAFCDWAYSRSVRDNLAFLESLHYLNSPGSNLRINAMISLLMVQLALDGEPGVPDMSAERQRGLLMLEASLNAAVGPDGYPAEDLCYGTSTVAKCAQVVEPLRRAGWFDAYQACPRYSKFGRAVLHFVEPWGERVSLTGDNVDSVPLRELVLARQSQETGDASLLWLLGALSSYTDAKRRVTLADGYVVTADSWSLLMLPTFRQARTPAQLGLPTAFRDRGRGIVSFRSGWKADDTLVVFDGSQRPAGAPGHAHASGGHFSVSALGESFAISPGRYNMEQQCHNVALIDGKSGEDLDGQWTAVKHAARLIEFTPGSFVDSAGVDSSQQHNAYWARRWLGLVKGDKAPAYAVVIDDINPGDRPAEYVWQLHTMRGNRIEIDGQRATIHGTRKGNLLDVHFCLPSPKIFPDGKGHTLTLAQDIAGPSAFHYVANPKAEAEVAASPEAARMFQRPRLMARIAGPNGHIMALLLPRVKGSAPAAVESLTTLPGALAIRVTFAEVEDIVVFAFDHGVLEAADICARGRWCVVRRDRRSGEVVDHALGEGAGLTVGGKTIAVR
jgi:hypothetical protein